MAGFKIPLDAYAVAVPMAYACFAISGLVVKTLTADPELKYRLQDYEGATSEDQLAKESQSWDRGVKEMFRQRINGGKFNVFNNTGL